MKGLYGGMCCGFRTHTHRPRRFFPKLFLIVTPLEFYSSARLQLVLLTCLISFCLHHHLHTHTQIQNYCMWSCVVSVLELVNSKNCPRSWTQGVLWSRIHLQGRQLLLQGKKRALACVASCLGSSITPLYRPTLRFPCPHTCLLSELAEGNNHGMTIH